MIATNFFDGYFFGGGFFGTAPGGGGTGTGGPGPGSFPYPAPKGRKEIERDRERFGVYDEERRKRAEAIVREVAKRQAERLERDQQKQLEELMRELALADLEFESGFLELLGLERSRLIEAEIARRLATERAQLLAMQKAQLTALALAAARSELDEQLSLLDNIPPPELAPLMAEVENIIKVLTDTFQSTLAKDLAADAVRKAAKPKTEDEIMAERIAAIQENFLKAMEAISAGLTEPQSEAKTLTIKH